MVQQAYCSGWLISQDFSVVQFRMKLLPHPNSFSITSSREQRVQIKRVGQADSPMPPFFVVAKSHCLSLSPSFPYSDSSSIGFPSVALCSLSCSSFLGVNRGAGEGNTHFSTEQFRASHLERTSDVQVSRALGEEGTDGKAEGFGVSWKLCLKTNNTDLWEQQYKAKIFLYS